MFFKKDSIGFGLILGAIAPVLGLFLFKMYNYSEFSYNETLKYWFVDEPGHRTLSAGLSVSLLLNALLFTIYINSSKDKTAKGIFAFTVVYGLIVLSLKTFG
ncbi:MAG: hypothetical protein ACOYKE_15635 [Ferruginibacter sp.]